ncbi:MAG TPA: heavy metal translocating P-type ATPase [Verrucomicrobiales bacterium]|nr:heavy metal translocating P-type ATPase [Verrucomicrobiales bacterium]
MAWLSLRQRQLSLEVPIAVGITALFAQSVFEVVSGRGEGYFDSLAGLLFFLLCGRVFQQKVFDRLSFDRDYRSFFPLSVIRIQQLAGPGSNVSESEQRVSLAQIQVGDRLRLRHGELIPADARLLRGEARVDYSFVTGESKPIRRQLGELLYAGGCQTGGTIDVEIVKPVAQSYLTSLWNRDLFRKDKDDTFNTLTNRYSGRFTWVILGIATMAGLFWAAIDPTRGMRAFVGVLIVACPCALALAAPFTLGTAVRVLGRRGIFLRNPHVIEILARISSVVFDKTGTLTAARSGETSFVGGPLSAADEAAIRALALQSAHPLAGRIAAELSDERANPPAVREFQEHPGAGVSGQVEGVPWKLGSADWLRGCGVAIPVTISEGPAVHVARNGHYQGLFTMQHPLRPEIDQLIQTLSLNYELALLSGDNADEVARFQKLFGLPATLEFNQSPANKLEFIRARQQQGQVVMMVGDGLNDAGALRQSDVGVAVVEQIGAFSPASDVILEASRVQRLGNVIRFARNTVGVVRVSFVISSLYNLVGLSIAAAGQLSPVVCAVLMPLSSVTVIAFAVVAVHWVGRRAGLGPVLTEPTEVRL